MNTKLATSPWRQTTPFGFVTNSFAVWDMKSVALIKPLTRNAILSPGKLTIATGNELGICRGPRFVTNSFAVW
jgi:hypothetical protein